MKLFKGLLKDVKESFKVPSVLWIQTMIWIIKEREKSLVITFKNKRFSCNMKKTTMLRKKKIIKKMMKTKMKKKVKMKKIKMIKEKIKKIRITRKGKHLNKLKNQFQSLLDQTSQKSYTQADQKKLKVILDIYLSEF